MSAKELDQQYKEMYAMVLELMGIVKTALKRLKKLEEMMGAQEISES